MIELNGKYTDAKIYTDNVEQKVISQVYDLLNHPMFEDEIVRIMPDTHAGKGCVIGLTSTNKNKTIIPNIIGVDIGCGMSFVNLGKIDLDLKSIDVTINKIIPSGANVNNNPKLKFIDKNFRNEIKNISEKTNSDYSRHLKSLGTLGGGNHFIEIAVDKKENKWLIIHSGSRNFGLQIAKYHQRKAEEYCNFERKRLKDVKNKHLGRFKQQGINMSDNFVQECIKDIENSMLKYKISKDLSFLENEDYLEYIYDMQIAQEFASLNREIIIKTILDFLKISSNINETIHNYYDGEIIRKGAISSKDGELVLIPINMRDGSILAVGKGNEDYNNSAPHGAGRLMSRSKAKELLSMEEFTETMSDVYSTSVVNSTLDEAPMAYKPIEEILLNIKETVEVIDILKPIYNFKAK